MAKNDRKNQMSKYKNLVKHKLAKLSAGDVDPKKKDADDNYIESTEERFGKGNSVTPKQKVNRIRYVEEMMIKAFTTREINYHCKYVWGLSTNNAKEIVKEARANMRQDFRENFEDEVDWHVEIRKNLLRKHIASDGDIKSSIGVLDSIAKIEGVYDNKPAVEITGSEFDVAAESLGEEETQKMISDIRVGDETALEKAREEYYEKDERKKNISRDGLDKE